MGVSTKQVNEMDNQKATGMAATLPRFASCIVLFAERLHNHLALTSVLYAPA